MTMRPPVIVTDGEQRAALAIVRSLGRAGYRCVVTSASGSSIAGASRHCAAEAAVPDPLRAPDDFAGEIERLVSRHGARLVIPVGEAAMLALLPVRERLAPAIIPFGELESFRRLSHKAELLEVARALGVAIPAQRVLASSADARDLDFRALSYPLVLKPARSIGERAGQRRSLRVAHATSAAELRDMLGRLPDEAHPLLLQERVIGPGIGIFLLRWDDEIIASFAHRRLREKPPSGGISVYRESIAEPPALLESSRALLDHFAWRGVAMVEYKVHAATGVPYLMEINGRFWGSLQLAIDAGVDFPRLLAGLALGERVERAPRYRRVRSRWWWGEVDHLLIRLRRPRRELHLSSDAPSIARAMYDFLASPLRPRDREEIFRFDDPRPFLRESHQWFCLS